MIAKICGLKKYYNNTKAVDGVSFSFSSGQIFGFVGPNGAGKTTTIRILATLLDPTAGDAFINGVSVVEEPEKARHFIGYMPDTLPTHSDITVHDYLDFFARAYRVDARKRKKVVEGVEEFANLTGIRDKFLKALSKGMKQRVSLGRALVHDPEVLILDEPAAGLDPRARVELRELLKCLSEQGKAILISSHILTELAEICDGAVIIEQGHLLQAGSIEQLQSQGKQMSTITLRALERQAELFKQLMQTAGVENVRWSGQAIEFDTQAQPETHGNILTDIVQRGYKVIDYHHRQADLEDIFMNLTNGEVQ